MNTSHEAPIACNINALDATQQERREAIAKQMNNATLQIQELPDGYMFSYPADLYLILAEFVSLERKCCPFFTFMLTVEHNNGPLWFQITGRAGVKEFMQEELGLH